MNPDRWQRIKDLFGEARECEPAKRAAFLAKACEGDEELRREVNSLLESDQQTGGLFDTPAAAAFAAAPAKLDPLVGCAIGPYRIVRRIGSGGMGSVYLAERSDDQFRRRVAVKAMAPELADEESLRRFQNERQTLAALDHPNIIRLLDGGTTEDGTPYLVMEYVEGQPIDEYCDSRKLSTNERLKLFRAVCSAVSYAHQNLVVHRDLKPGNVLVAPDGVPKLLDFGIAKLLRPEYLTNLPMTRSNLRPMTPEYASPEQILGQPITTASDIYSLGVLLYRLLTSSHPYQTQSAIELERAICQVDPERPSASVLRDKSHLAIDGGRENLARCLKGDLDMIVLMAMRKEPQRRYPSAEHLSEDIRRYLDGLPVTACKDSWRYRGAKFVRRNKAAVAAAVLIMVTLISSTLIALNQKQVAEKRFQDLRQFAKWVLIDLDGAMRAGETAARKELVRKAMEYLDAMAHEAGGDTTIRRDLIEGYIKMGDVQGNLYGSNLGESSGAQQSYSKALEIAETMERSRPNDPETRRELALANTKLADVLALTGSGAEALRKYERARQLSENLQKEHPSSKEYLPSLMRVWERIGNTQGQLGDPVGRLQSLRRSLEIGQTWLAVDPKAKKEVDFISDRVTYFQAVSGDSAGAEEKIQERLHIYEVAASADPSDKAWRNVAKWHKLLAEVQKRIGKPAEALRSVRRSLDITEKLRSTNPRDKLLQIDSHQARMLLVDVLALNGRQIEARLETDRLLRFLKPLVEREDASVYQIKDYCELLETTPFADLQNAPEALRYAQKAVAMTHEKDISALDLLARAYAMKSDLTNALANERKAINLLPPADPSRETPELRKTLESNLARWSGMQTETEPREARR